jgi:hypothetical protein
VVNRGKKFHSRQEKLSFINTSFAVQLAVFRQLRNWSTMMGVKTINLMFVQEHSNNQLNDVITQLCCKAVCKIS